MIKEINLKNFKIHKKCDISIKNKISLIYGNNSIGKTSLLDSINLFNAQNKITNIESFVNNEETSFQVNLKSMYDYKISYNQTKNIQINEISKKSIDLLNYIQIFYLHPYNMQIFWKDLSYKRKMFDKIISQNNLVFLKAQSIYSKILKQRNKLIEENQFNSYWKFSLNSLIKENGNIINNYRKEKIDLFNKISNEKNLDIKINISPTFEEQERIFNSELKDNFVGIHKTKFNITKNDNQLSNAQAHKVLINLISLAFNNTINDKILLLDDIFAYLDANSLKFMLETLEKNDFQTIITGINPINNSSVDNISLF